VDLSRLEFDTLEPQIAGPFKFGPHTCMLIEGTSATVAAHDNRKLGRAKLGADGSVSLLGTLGDLPRFVVHLHLLKTDKPPVDCKEETLAPLRFLEEDIAGWRDEVVEAVYEACINMTPSLRPQTTVEALIEQRDKLNDRIAKLEAKKGDPKDSPAATSESSSTPQS
jgi:hypothetical protein